MCYTFTLSEQNPIVGNKIYPPVSFSKNEMTHLQNAGCDIDGFSLIIEDESHFSLCLSLRLLLGLSEDFKKIVQRIRTYPY